MKGREPGARRACSRVRVRALSRVPPPSLPSPPSSLSLSRVCVSRVGSLGREGYKTGRRRRDDVKALFRSGLIRCRSGPPARVHGPIRCGARSFRSRPLCRAQSGASPPSLTTGLTTGLISN